MFAGCCHVSPRSSLVWSPVVRVSRHVCFGLSPGGPHLSWGRGSEAGCSTPAAAFPQTLPGESTRHLCLYAPARCLLYLQRCRVGSCSVYDLLLPPDPPLHNGSLAIFSPSDSRAGLVSPKCSLLCLSLLHRIHFISSPSSNLSGSF